MVYGVIECIKIMHEEHLALLCEHDSNYGSGIHCRVGLLIMTIQVSELHSKHSTSYIVRLFLSIFESVWQILSLVAPRFSMYPAIGRLCRQPFPTFNPYFGSLFSLSTFPSVYHHLMLYTPPPLFFFYTYLAMVNLTPLPTTASKLRTLLAQENEIVVCPGVYDGFTARLALNAGFKIFYMASR